MGLLTEASAMHLLVGEARVQQSVDYDFLVALYFELDGMILDMNKNPTPLAQYRPLLKSLIKDQGQVSDRIDDLMMNPEEEIYMAEYFDVSELESEELGGSDDWKDLEGPYIDGSVDASYFVTGVISWEFTPYDADELMNSTGETWDDVYEGTVQEHIIDKLHSIHKYSEHEGTEECDYGTISFYTTFGDPEANT